MFYDDNDDDDDDDDDDDGHDDHDNESRKVIVGYHGDEKYDDVSV